MTPKEKAIELFDKYMGFKMNPYDDLEMTLKKGIAKDNALIAVDYIMSVPKQMLYTIYVHRLRTVEEMAINNWNYEEPMIVDEFIAFEYWQKVKQEIELI